MPKKRLGTPPKYDFASIRPGGEMLILTDNPQSVRNSAYAYAASRNPPIRLKTEQNEQGTGIYVRRPKKRRDE